MNQDEDGGRDREPEVDGPATADEEVEEADKESFPASDPPESHHID